jgi:hypothetical protein
MLAVVFACVRSEFRDSIVKLIDLVERDYSATF